MVRYLNRLYGKIISWNRSVNWKCVSLLKLMGLWPVLVDVGSAGKPHAIWAQIAPRSIVVGFDPDSRDNGESFGRGYARAIMIKKAVVPDEERHDVDFILTDNPRCSSTLEPDLNSLGTFSFRDYFNSVDKVTVAATSLNRVLITEGVECIHWLKLDSQGIDLRLLKSLSTENFNNLLAVDVEPGLIHAYKGEDLFVDCHEWLISNGFWLSRMECQAYPKITPEALRRLHEDTGIRISKLLRTLRSSPTAAECRYLREVGWLANIHNDAGVLILGAVFGILDSQFGYAYEVALLYEDRFGKDDNSNAIKNMVYRYN